MKIIDLLRTVRFGERVAEEEVDQLASYFVETDHWRRLYADQVDIVYGAKGAGKSALYALLVAKKTELFESGSYSRPPRTRAERQHSKTSSQKSSRIVVRAARARIDRMRTAHLWIPLFALCFTTEASAQKPPDVILLDTGCLSMGSVLGKNDMPMVSKITTTSIFICNKAKGGLACQMSSLKGGKYLGAGKAKAVAFTFLSDTGDRFQLVMEGALAALYVDRNAEESTGLMIQKQCVGVYAAGGRVAELLKRIEN